MAPASDSAACEVYISLRYAASGSAIPLLENVSQVMGLRIRITPTVFRVPLLSVITPEKYQTSQESSGPNAIRELLGRILIRKSHKHLSTILGATLTNRSELSVDLCTKFVLSGLLWQLKEGIGEKSSDQIYNSFKRVN